MNVLLISDSHGCTNNLKAAIEKEPQCGLVIFLGDGLRDLERCKPYFPDKKFLCVKGNNDYGYNDEPVAYKYIETNTVVYTHGHTFGVKYSLSDLIDHAAAVRANVAFYGHTHKANVQFDAYKGVYLVNPGALCDGKYAVVTLGKNGADAQLKTL
ncbi:MAG: YfcE family phosphodiesterase [Ruminococcus sp.]|nr:YfcE family phosphodiesterase [Ruminococcus sp.]